MINLIKKQIIFNHFSKLILYFFILLILVIITTPKVLADTQGEYESCLKNCYANFVDNAQFSICQKQCQGDFPQGSQAYKQSTTGLSPVGLESKQQLFVPNVPVGDFKGSIPVDQEILGKYLNAWYKFVVGVVGILATVIMMWGGFKWLTSRGNAAAIGDAKDRIWSAVIGLVLVFLSYNILFIINRQLVNPTLPDLKGLPGSHGFVNQSSTPASASQQPGARQPVSDLCQGPNSQIIDYSNVPARDPGVPFPSEMDSWFDQYGTAYGVDPNVLRAISAAESSGNPRAVSPAGAYGLMQILPSTATAVVGHDSNLNSMPEFADRQISGTELINNPELSVAIAASFVNANQDGLGQADVFAGYNAGYADGVGNALGQSRDCSTPGVRAYQCCINPGGLAETQGYVNNTMAYYNYYDSQ